MENRSGILEWKEVRMRDSILPWGTPAVEEQDFGNGEIESNEADVVRFEKLQTDVECIKRHWLWGCVISWMYNVENRGMNKMWENLWREEMCKQQRICVQMVFWGGIEGWGCGRDLRLFLEQDTLGSWIDIQERLRMMRYSQQYRRYDTARKTM